MNLIYYVDEISLVLTWTCIEVKYDLNLDTKEKSPGSFVADALQSDGHKLQRKQPDEPSHFYHNHSAA